VLAHNFAFPGRGIWLLTAFSGFFGGLVYWLMAGRSADSAHPCDSVGEGREVGGLTRESAVQEMAASGPTLPTWAVHQVGSYLGDTGRDANVVVKAARDPY
jgi:hypothetical protein